MNTKQNFKGLVIDKDEQKCKQHFLAYAKAEGLLNRYKQQYEALDEKNYQFTEKDLSQIAALIERKGEVKQAYFERLKRKYITDTQNQLKAAKLTAKVITEAATTQAAQDISELQKVFESIYEFVLNSALGTPTPYPIDLSLFSLIDGGIALSEKSIQTINSLHEEKIKTDLESEFYELVVELQKSYSKVRDFAASNTILGKDLNLFGSYPQNTSNVVLIENLDTGEAEVNGGLLRLLKSKK